MRLSVRFLLLLFPVLAAVAIVFNGLMDRLERQWQLKDLNNRSKLVYDSIQDPVIDAVTTPAKASRLQRIYERISDDPSLLGVLVCSKDGAVISRSAKIAKKMKCPWVPEGKVAEVAAKRESGLQNVDGVLLHQSIFPVLDEERRMRAYVVVLHDPSEVRQRSELTRRYTLYAFLGLGLLISLITLLVYRWSVSRPVEQLSEVMKGVLTGDTKKITKALENTDFAPLVKDLDQMIMEFRQVKGELPSESSNLWTASKLNQEMQRLFGESRLCVIANQEPYVHNRVGTQVLTEMPASGLVGALEPVIRTCSGVWIAFASGNADKETADKTGMLLVPPHKPEYALKRVWLSRDEEQGFFHGFCKEGLWPLCHIAHERPVFRQDDWQQYVSVNAKFAATFSEELRAARPVALIQDYHFSLAPSMVRKMRPDAITGLFWHIPWPSSETFRILPWHKELLLGILGADLIGFQSQYYCNAFLDSVDRFLEARVSREQLSVTIQGHTCYVRPFPVGVEWPNPYRIPVEEYATRRSRLCEQLGISPKATLGLAVDRLDYTKGILERFQAYERFLERNPDQVGRVVLIQILAPGRMHLKRYQDLQAEVQKTADRINWRFYTPSYQPISLRMEVHNREQLFQYYRAADFCFVNSIHDGMNLVAKEFVSARDDEDGVLILSSFAGAARDLKDALVVNPYDIEECADAIARALNMAAAERRGRMEKLRAVVANANIYGWGAQLLSELHRIANEGRRDPG